jgi:NAD(P)-dependent dehydrogenase (short-subunit alcohol dehydrogenase family)
MTLLPLLDAGNKKPPAGRNSNFISSVINITSISGIVKISQGHYAYNSSKAATNSLTMMLANELKFGSAANIRVNAIAPGLFPTEMTSRGKASTDGITHPDQLSGFINPAGRPGEAEEMANAILFLATNSYVTGQVSEIRFGKIFKSDLLLHRSLPSMEALLHREC